MNSLQNPLKPPKPRNKVRNILVRHCGSKEMRSNCLADKNYQHPENCYLVKYFPKYYHNLTLLMKPGHLLSSKIKRIKKLRRFTANFNNQIPQVNWFKILKHNRKEIEEFPAIHLSQNGHVFWAKTTLCFAKFFFNVTKLQVPTFASRKFDGKRFLAVWEAFSVHLRNMRRLKTLEICMDRVSLYDFDPNILKSLYQELNTMPRLLQRLEVLKSLFSPDVSQDSFSQKKNIFLNLTNLNYIPVSLAVSPSCQAIPQLCKNLKSFSLHFRTLRADMNFDPSRFRSFITSIQELPKLQSIRVYLEYFWPHDFWSYFTPPASLRKLTLHFKASDMRDAIFQVSSSYESENFVKHWKQIKELDALNLNISCQYGDEMLFAKNLVTAVLKKISKLTSFQYKTDFEYEGIWRYKPFFIEEVPHLYEHLRKFKVSFPFSEGSINFNLSFLRPFKNLKEIKCKGYSDSWTNIEDAVLLLEENTTSGEFPTLKLGAMNITYMEEFKKLLKKISKTKRNDTNLKIMLALNFDIQAGDDEIRFLDQFCNIIESEAVKGLEILLEIRGQNYSGCDVDEVKRIVRKHPGLKNFEFQIYFHQDVMHYLKRDGEKEQLLFYLDEF